MVTGLSTAEAVRRLKQFGPNALPDPERRSPIRIAFEIVRQPMFALLLSGAAIYLLLGEPFDAGVLALFATLSVSISIVQESRSETVLESLRSLASPRALVIRDGEWRRIAARELVPDDTILLTEGDRVPADARLIGGGDLVADESLLTGESVPVRKNPATNAIPISAPGGEDLPFVFAGTLIVRGSGTAKVTTTGLSTEMGKIGQSLRAISTEQPRLRKQLGWLVRDFARVGLIVTALVVVLSGWLRGSWLQAVLGGIAIGMSVLPEEIPLVLTVFMAMGAWRISRVGVLTRRAAAIETLGSATVLCTDKTGTLTQNRMRVEVAVAGARAWHHGDPPDSEIRDLLAVALGASSQTPTDPMDRAIHDVAGKVGLAPPGRLMKSYGIQPEFPAVANLWEGTGENIVMACVKGAPEIIADLCALTPDERRRLLVKADGFAVQGLRLLAVAKTSLTRKESDYPPSIREIRFAFQGLMGFADPLREAVPGAISECHAAGIRVIMITGDYPATARVIAAQAGIGNGKVLSGEMLESMDETALREILPDTSIFARVRPQQKLRLVSALKARGEVVAMTGDGVNDAPAMKAADIGIAMGGRGTDVAREASAIVLLGDDFSSIVHAIRLGRRIYDNLRKAIGYIVAVHIPIAGLALLPLLLGLPLMLMPIHIALLEMVIDPACSIVFEAEKEERDIMRRPPRRPDMPVLPRRAALWASIQGGSAFLIVAAALFLGKWSRLPQDELRSLVFAVLALTNFSLILVNRSFNATMRDALLRPNKSLWILTAVFALVLTAALFWPPAQAAFRFRSIHVTELLYCVLAGGSVVVALEAVKSRAKHLNPFGGS